MRVKPRKIVVSRTDSIGDVVLTLPLAGILRSHFPNCKVIFLGQEYTEPIINCSEFVDEVWRWSEIKSQSNRVEWLKKQNVDVFIHVFPTKELALWAKKANVVGAVGAMEPRGT